MKNLSIVSFLIFVLFFCSCKKNTDNPVPSNPAASFVKSMVMTDTSGRFLASMSFQYDSNGKLTRMIVDNPPDNDSLIHLFEYYPSMVIEKIFYTNNDKYGRTVYSLNAGGLAVSATETGYSHNGDSSVAMTTDYKYIDGYLTEKKDCLFGDTATWMLYRWQITNGNNISMALGLSAWGGGFVTESYAFYPNSVNTMGNTNTGRLFLGKSNAGLIKSSVTNSSSPDSGTYSYSFDSMDRVIEEFIRGKGLTAGNTNTIITYY